MHSDELRNSQSTDVPGSVVGRRHVTLVSRNLQVLRLTSLQSEMLLVPIVPSARADTIFLHASTINITQIREEVGLLDITIKKCI